ncbi:hypothetical protein ACWGNA_22455 [Brucella cytisi]|uniref:hypothetical protein n=1 Tax=Brucella cytisi TaxID=407152 RepID=UPI0035E349E1
MLIQLEELLKDLGFETISANDGRTAKDKIDANSSRLCGLITDIIDGAEPDGWQLARHARAHVPMIPVLYVTGIDAVTNASDGEWSVGAHRGNHRAVTLYACETRQ